ncbi:DUF4157 domain-containing protein [Methylogaea oryzae]|uniref:eCIS core domain-containing protein n=1 Tax=Methylogaea oryzae TaxID=1295382 RepID=UPI001C3F2EFB|nr:DUF4157 domain-containing protein [Methylogaea oryzae]
MKSSVLQRQSECRNPTLEADECGAFGSKHGVLQRKAMSQHPSIVVPSSVYEVLNSPGQPLDAATRVYMESRYAQDFSDVRVHTDGKAAESAQAVNALAYTVGKNVVFDSGQYAPNTAEGRRLMAHELAHVIQQRFTAPAVAPCLRIGDANDPAEAEADRLAQRVVAGQAASVGWACGAYLARSEKEPATFDEKILQRLKAKPKGNDAASQDAWQQSLRALFKSVPENLRNGLAKRLAPKSKDALGQYFRAQIADESLRAELLELLGLRTTVEAPSNPGPTAAAAKGKVPADSIAQRIQKGLFGAVLQELNGMSMAAMLKTLKDVQDANLESLMLHIDAANPLGEASKNRMAAAIGAVHMSRNGVTTGKLDALDDAMDKAALPEDQRALIRAILPALPGGAATRVHTYFEPANQSLPQGDGGKIVEKWSTAKAYRVLKDLPAKELETTLAQIDKSQLQALMMSSRQAEQYGEMKLEQLRQALYVAWVTRFPEERAKFDVGEEENPILKMSTGAKIFESITRSFRKLPGQGWERLKELLTPEAIAMMVGFTAAYVVSQTTPVGWVADIIVGGLIAATVLMVGREAIDIVKLLIAFSKKASGATSEQDLDQAAELLATAVSKAGVDIILAILFHKAGKAANLKPPGPRSPGLLEVMQKGGGKIKTTLLDTPATADYVTEGGMVIRMPVEQVPGNIMMMEGTSGGASAPRGGVGAPGKGAPAKGPVMEAAGKPAKNLPGKKLAAADAVAKKKPSSPGELLAEAKKVAANEEPAAAAEKPSAAEKTASAEPAAKPVAIDPKVAAKNRVLSQIADNQALKTQIYSEIQEAVQRGKQRLAPEERTALDRQKAQLAKEAENAAKEGTELQKQLAELEVSPYQKARAYSFSDAAAKEVIRRARGLDEMSGKKAQEPSIDHIVPIEEIVEFERYNDLFWDDQQAVLSRVDNLRLMEKVLNSSKGSRRWANWREGLRAYGKEVWEKMVQTEGELRRLIQEDIKARAAKRHR